ncbi:MAG: hypothetical protein N2510_01515 [Ignavibacteria bacterium]|nr:hypothetical protein [Ignavibacteria bacterium]
MTFTRIVFFLTFLLAFISYEVNCQFLPSFGIAGGPKFGWNFNITKDLNALIKNGDFPETSDKGFFQMGGGGFIDLPVKKHFIRVGGFGNGFSTHLTKKINDTLTKATNYSMGEGGIGIEYIIPATKFLDLSFGTLISTGRLKLELYNYSSDEVSWENVFGEISSNIESGNLSRIFRSRFYSFSPQLGIGLMLRKYMYLKIDFGYQFSIHNTWTVDNEVRVRNFPEKIKATGPFINAGLNFGLFIR